VSLRKRTVTGLLWTLGQQVGVQGVNFVVQIVLARILLPEDFGLIAMLYVFIAIGNSLVDGGMTSSLIRTENPDNRDYSTVFYMNIVVSIVIYCVIFIGSPLIASFYSQSELSSILRIYSLVVVIQSFNAVQTSKLTKEMNFKLQMIMQIPSVLVAGVVGIVLAKAGFGVWSLVYMQLVNALLFTVQHWLFANWRPGLVFDKEKLKLHFSFGYKLTLSGLLSTVYSNIYKIIIGKYYPPAQLGFFHQANTLSMFPVNNLSKALFKVTFPVFSSIQHNEDKLRNAYLKTGRYVFWVICPVMIFLIFFAKPIFLILLTEKWVSAVPYFQILAAAAIFYPHSLYSLNILAAKGRSDLHLKIELYKKLLSIATLVILMFKYGIWGIVIASALSMLIHFVINAYTCGVEISYSFAKQIFSFVPALSLSCSLCISLLLIFGDKIQLVGLISVGFIYFLLYILMSLLTKMFDLKEVKALITQ